MHYGKMERFRLHHCGKIRLRASTLVETLVASVVFLIVFGMAMTSAVNLRKMQTPDWARIERDFNEFRKRIPENGEPYKYEWGRIEANCSDYQEVSGLIDVQVTLILRDGRKTVYRFLYCEEKTNEQN